MNDGTREQDLLRDVRHHLDRSTAELPEETLLRLRQARLSAVEAAGHRPLWFRLPRWVGFGGLATAAVTAVAVTLWFGSATMQKLPLRQPEEVEILTAQEHLELYEDLEFYRWLAVDERRPGGSAQ